MMKALFLCFVPMVFVAILLCIPVRSEEDDYLDRSLPQEVSAKPPQGEWVEVEMPETVDLVQRAEYALNMATRLWAPEWGYEQLFYAHMDENPPVLEMGHGGLLNCGPKVIEALPMLRAMTGSTERIEVDGKAMGSLLQNTGKDGLCYQPVEDRPWAFFEDATREIGKPYSDIFGEGRQLLTYAAWFQHDGNPLWKELAEKKIDKLLSMTLQKHDTLFFRLSRGYTPWDEDPTKGPVIPVGDHVVYKKSAGMTGTPASYIVGWIPQAGAIWHRLTGNPQALELASGLARYLYLHGEMLDPDTGAFVADHESHVTHSLFSNLSFALKTEHQPMIEWVKRGFDYNISRADPDRTGIVWIGIKDAKEACSLSDDIAVGITLSQHGVGDYWDMVDRWVRNSFLDMQVIETDWIEGQPVTEPDLKPGFIQPSDAAERCLGVWRFKFAMPRDSIGCCNGNCSRVLYYIWDNIITADEKQLKINLLMNRVSPWADIASWLPYEGKVVVDVKKDFDFLRIRIPEWADPEEVACEVNGFKVDGILEEGYLNIGHVREGRKVALTFPVPIRTVMTTINHQKTKVIMKGNTVLDASPDIPGYPIERHKKYREHEVVVKKKRYFVTEERFQL